MATFIEDRGGGPVFPVEAHAPRTPIDHANVERARSAAARMCAAARVLARHLDDATPARRASLLANIEAAEQEFHRLFR
ncbi:MAG TPA: hypothetical protein VGB19_02820 [Actinomycetota bacterium]